MNFVNDKSGDEDWKGYIYVLLMFVSATVQSIIVQQYFWLVLKLGMRIRTAILGVVYDKVRKCEEKHKLLCGCEFICMPMRLANLGLVHTYPGIFKNGLYLTTHTYIRYRFG